MNTATRTTMHAMVFDGHSPELELREVPIPEPGPGEVRVAISACGVCRTDLHIVDGELPLPKPALIPGHEIVGRVDICGPGVTSLRPGDRIGVPWLGRTCMHCDYCLNNQENLCDAPQFTGYLRDGGYAHYAVADAAYCFPIPQAYDDLQAAPLLCAGLIGLRTLNMAGPARRIGIYGFGAAAHLVAQIALARGAEIYAFTRPGDTAAQALAQASGALWTGGSNEVAPVALDAALIFAPVGALVPFALAAVRKGGTVVCGGIHMSDIPGFPYSLLWQERRLVSVANLTRADGHAMMRIADEVSLHMQVTPYALTDANRALSDLRAGRLAGAAVLRIGP
ncbi:zinc-dependent alcohol dehydrogenase family protein [Cupriavidus sp. UGS-1]|uniref:zinc-dependent alcohol dehydrogenase family protein n=1 Tax=Cupriavidus sp. UGS-1 TaxID=2899826 RepID=UPI00351D909E